MKNRFLHKVKSLLYVVVAVMITAMLFLTACGPGVKQTSDALTFTLWNALEKHQPFFDFLHEEHPEIELELISYRGANRTEYSWVQMRNDDISDIFITSQIVDADVAKDRLVDLSSYSFINNFSDTLLNQLRIDGGIYLLPTDFTMYGILYNKTLMKDNGWEVPKNFEELKTLCAKIRAANLIPGIAGTALTGSPFSAVFNLAKTTWFTTPDGVRWERDFLAGNETAKGMWESTMAYVQKYIDIGMFNTDQKDRGDYLVTNDYLGNRRAVFFTGALAVSSTKFMRIDEDGDAILVDENGHGIVNESGDEIGMMPYISEDGSKNVYMYAPSSYYGISKKLTEKGNEKKLENAVKLMSTMFSERWQSGMLKTSAPSIMSVLNTSAVPKDSLIYDAQQAMWDGRAFAMTYANWDGVLANIGQAYKEWFRGEEGVDGKKCIERMDALQSEYLAGQDHLNFCESTANFTLQQTAELVGKALGAYVDACDGVVADAVMISLNDMSAGGGENSSGISGKLYAGKINSNITMSIIPDVDKKYVVMTMTGAQAKVLQKRGLELLDNGKAFPYVLVTRGGVALKDDKAYKIVFYKNDYTMATAEKYNAIEYEWLTKNEILCDWLKKQVSVSPNGNPWE